MADATADQVRRYVLDGSDDDPRRLLSLSESFAEHARRALRRLGVGPGWTVIDCGCGPIGGLAILAEMVGPAGRVVGVDFSEPTIQYARSVMAALGLENVELVAGDIHQLDAATLGGPFDLAFTRAFLIAGEMIDDVVAILRAAKAGGYEWVTSPFLIDLVLRKPQSM
jgi:ubiquinone/menaquinone biosynthesis C-methylase UbiE